MMDEIIDQVVTCGSIPATLVNDEETKRLGAATTVAQQCGEIGFKMEIHQELGSPSGPAFCQSADLGPHPPRNTQGVAPQKTPLRHTR
jgi:hypothetical protein